jgi:hypothetical protein
MGLLIFKIKFRLKMATRTLKQLAADHRKRVCLRMKGGKRCGICDRCRDQPFMAKIEEDRNKIELCKMAPHEPEEVKELAQQNLEKYLRGYDGREARVHHVLGFCLHYKLYFN